MINYGIEKMDLYNSSNATAFKDAVGVQGPLQGVAILESTDTKTSVIKKIPVLKINGNMYSGNSTTMLDSVERLTGVFTEEECLNMEVIIKKGTSKQGRDFVFLDIVKM